jgi:hypothetical protein
MIENKFIYISVEKLQTLLSENYHVQLLDSEIMQVLGDNICKHSKKLTNSDTHTICMRKLNKNASSDFCSRHCPEKRKEYREKMKQRRNDRSSQESSTHSHVLDDSESFENEMLPVNEQPISDAENDTKDIFEPLFDQENDTKNILEQPLFDARNEINSVLSDYVDDDVEFSFPDIAILSKEKLCKIFYNWFVHFVDVILRNDGVDICAKSKKFLKELKSFYRHIGIECDENIDDYIYSDDYVRLNVACKRLRNDLISFELQAMEQGLYTEVLANLMNDIRDLFDQRGLTIFLDDIFQTN